MNIPIHNPLLQSQESNEQSKVTTNAVTRRDFLRIAGVYGVVSTALAASALGGVMTVPSLANAAEENYRKRTKVPAKHNFKMGGSSYDAVRMLTARVGMLEFIRDLEERTDGAIRIEFFGGNSISTDLNGIKKAQQGIIDFFHCTTQNAAASAPYYNVFDFPYMFPNRASIYHVMYDPRSYALFRDPILKMHGTHMLFGIGDLRCFCLSEKYRNKTSFSSVEDLKGMKIRSTGSHLGIIGMQKIGVNPVPVAFEETADAMRQGLIDGMELPTTGVAMSGMAAMVSHHVGVDLFPAIIQTGMTDVAFKKLDANLQEATLESAYLTQIFCQLGHEAALADSVGVTEPPQKGTAYEVNKVKVSLFSTEEKEKCAKLSSPQYVPEPYAEWSDRLNKWSGGKDVFKEISSMAREIPLDSMAEKIPSKRWWKS